MQESKYKTTLSIGKFIEVAGWIIVVVAGLIAILGITKGLSGLTIMLLPALGIGIGGILIVYTGQLILIFVDIENNTRQAVSEIKKTNAMLADTLGSIAANLSKLAAKESLK